MNAPRKLAAILAADVAGYSRLICIDEEGTLKRLRKLRRELINPAVSLHRGRIVKTTGDGILIEFPSVVDAVRCALDVQHGMVGRNSDFPAEQRIEFRVGINLGDVVIEGEDLLGDSVNVAARLEGISEPGGICISDAAYHQVRDKLDVDFEDAGEQQLKNIARPVRIYRLRVDRSLAQARPALPLPYKPSIAVLPFTNRSGDPQQDYFADGLSEDLITSLSKFADLFVIARHSAFRYRGTDLDVRQIGRELGIRYLLVGSVRRDAERVRITAQLVDVGTTAQLWAEHYDRELTGIFAVQDEVTQRIVGTLIARISRSELERALAKPPEAFSAYDYFLRGSAIMKSWHSDPTGEMIATARSFYERAIAADPTYAPPVQGLAWAYLAAWIEPWPHHSLAHEYQQPETLERALALAQKAVELDPNLPDAHLTLGGILQWLHRRPESWAEYERAFELNPNLADYRYALSLIHGGRTEEGMDHLTRIIRLDPFHAPACLTFLGNALYQTGRYAEAIESLRAAARRLPAFRPTYVWLAAAAGQLGYDKEAQEASARVLQRDPAFTISKWLQLHQFAKQADADRVAEGLRKALLPE